MDYRVEALPNRIYLGLEGTNKQKVLNFDVSDWQKQWPDATFNLAVKKPDGTVYFGNTELDGSILRWTIGYADVDKIGNGKAGIHAVVNDVYAKSVEFTTVIAESFTGSGGEYPEASEPWTARVEQAAAEAAAMARDAEQSATAAAESEAVARELLEHLPDKVNVDQGVEHAGKILGIGADGKVTPVTGGSGGGSVDSVNGKTGVVVLDASDVGAASTQALAAETQRATAAEQTIAGNLSAESRRAQAAEQANAAAIAAQSETIAKKLDAPETPGTAGQVLTKDTNLQEVWADPSGGGVDYLTVVDGKVCIIYEDGETE